MSDIVAARLRAQHLAGPQFREVAEAVRHFGAVQAQDYPAAKWALGLRVKGETDSTIDTAYDSGAILRTHVLRPTWHFVVPEDIRWMVALTGPKIRQAMVFRYRQLELDPPTISRAHRVFEKALAGGRAMTRPELGQELGRSGIAPDGQRLAHLLVSGELAGLLVGGPRQGKQLTYAWLDDRVQKTPDLDREQAIGELTRRYFMSHGPAQVRDLVWWSGLTQVEVRRGIALAGGALEKVEIDGATYWLDARLGSPRLGAVQAHLLPNFDEYTVGYTDRSAMLHPLHPFRPELFAFSSLLANVVTIGGQVCAAWRRQTDRDGLVIEVRPLVQLRAADRSLVEAAAARYARFLDRRVRLAWP